MQLLGGNPPMFHIFPVEVHPSARGIEEERMDEVHGRPVPREDRISGRAEHDSTEPGLFADLHQGSMFGIFAAFDVSRDGGPASLEGADFVAGATPPTKENGVGEMTAVPDARPGTIPRARILMRSAPARSPRRRR